ncbi:MAG: pyridoxal-phosphate dependent enzyme [Candidatus Thermoplasmatota archaeon]|nr:pyridoxal-phosphate dependent enzyme [Candidatus Thermoplasmatota archaeon]MEC8076553.1 pyridoxal-phosphate dependent enzyme [Candidatus Thermoplasmatota archaeon]MEC8446975.1 pyridoxal-phosphate dependent enzyme [Candidatus Thermoplasmatota archaeon]MEE3081790.1 pyridoxal-phosphate dependent enzyme [Candidatus Thermoplasmatota archaeon]|tara:strand:- start:52 stop:1008 length:957 start_codon:yes stop_codon:yes gene_type:complete
MTKYAASMDDVIAASKRIEGHGHRTPILTNKTIDELTGKKIFFKCENFQKIGAFKFRGGWNTISSLSGEEASKGVCTHSSGNHAQAVAYAAMKRNIPAHIVMPRNAPKVKIQAVEGYRANITLCEPTLKARRETLEKIAEKTGAYVVHPFNEPKVIAGQGTCAMEMIEDIGDLDAICAPIGGGGLMSGTCIAARSMLPNVRLFGAEPKGADDAYQSLKKGKLIPQNNPKTICDGLLTSMGENTWNILKDHLEDIITVSDEEIVTAMKLIWERMKIIIEPSCATPLAAVLTPEFRELENIETIGIILTGGNVDLSKLPF